MLNPLRVIVVCFLIGLWSPTLGQDAVFNISKPKIDLVGIWRVTRVDTTKPPIEDYCQFTADKKFFELKNQFESKRIDELAPDEQGVWKLKGDTLCISVIGEKVGSTYQDYNEPQEVFFLVRQEDEFIFLSMVNDFEEVRLERLED